MLIDAKDFFTCTQNLKKKSYLSIRFHSRTDQDIIKFDLFYNKPQAITQLCLC